MIQIFILISMLIVQVRAQEKDKVDSIILQDLIANSTEKVDIEESNSAGCKKPCTVKNYLSTHFGLISEEIEKIKRTPKKDYKKVFGTSVSEDDKYKTLISGECLSCPFEDARLFCHFKLGFAFGEIVWSEELRYLKNSETNEVIAGSFWAFGTP